MRLIPLDTLRREREFLRACAGLRTIAPMPPVASVLTPTAEAVAAAVLAATVTPQSADDLWSRVHARPELRVSVIDTLIADGRLRVVRAGPYALGRYVATMEPD